MSIWEAAGRIIGALVALALVLFLAWWVLRWVNKRVPGMGAAGGANRLIKVLDRVSVGKNSTVVLMRVEDKVLLVAVSEHAIEKLQEFDDPDGKIKLPETPQNLQFSSVMKDAMSRFTGKDSSKDGGKDNSKPAGALRGRGDKK